MANIDPLISSPLRGAALAKLLTASCLLFFLGGCGESEGEPDPSLQVAGPIVIPADLKADPGAERVEALIEIGREAFVQKGCIACHAPDGQPLTGPGLAGIFGQSITLKDGQVIDRDLAYLYKSIVVPNEYTSKAGSVVMPPYAYLDEQTLVGLSYFIRSLSDVPLAPGEQEGTTRDE